MTDHDRPIRLASSPCMADGVSDPEQARDVARWRKAQRMRLLAERDALGVAARQTSSIALMAELVAHLRARFGSLRGRVFAGYWPIKGEPDLRPLFRDLHTEGAQMVLPVVKVKAAPLVFRRWTPETRMVRGHWNIPVPPPEAEVLGPDICLAPVVGFSDDGYRLGYGGGYFDRTLASLSPRPYTIGIGYAFSRLPTIFPQPHDIPLNVILVEAGNKPLRADL